MKTARVLSPTETAEFLPALRTLADAGVHADANEQFSDQTWVELHRGTAGLLITDDAGTLTGAAAVVLGRTITIEILVHPNHRNQGWGRALATATAELVAEHRNLNPVDQVTAWTHGNHPVATTLAAEHGLKPVRELYRMGLVVPAHGWEEKLPDGVRIRTFEPGADDARWLKLNATAFADHPEQGQLTQQDLDSRKNEDWFSAAGFFVAEPIDATADTDFLGYHWTKFPVGSDAGEVYAVGVSPEAQGTGLGRVLTARGMNHLKDTGAQRIVLYVDDANQPAVKLYESLGFDIENTDVMFQAPAQDSAQ